MQGKMRKRVVEGKHTLCLNFFLSSETAKAEIRFSTPLSIPATHTKFKLHVNMSNFQAPFQCLKNPDGSYASHAP